MKQRMASAQKYKGAMSQDKETSSLWCYTPLSRFERPGEPAVQAAHSGLKQFWKRMRRRVEAVQTSSVHAELRSVPQGLLDRVAPAPRWDAAGRALDVALAEWATLEDTQQHIKVIIGPSGAGVRNVVSAWAKGKNLRVVHPPSYQEILRGSADWRNQISEGENLLVIPNLERFLLRHYNGLESVRWLIETIDASKMRFVIGCNSWAWIYLSRVIQIDAILPEPLTLVAFDGSRLQHWFQILPASGGGSSFVFRQADDGSYVLPPADFETSEGGSDDKVDEGGFSGKKTKVSSFVQRIGARSRGNPLVAWAFWRHCLNIARGEDAGEEAREAAADDRGPTIWVRPWSQIEFPDLPQATPTCELFMLHALLLHDGLPAPILASVLPIGRPEIVQGLYRLRSAGLVKEEGELWRVTLLGYPAVRNALDGENYLVDGF